MFKGNFDIFNAFLVFLTANEQKLCYFVHSSKMKAILAHFIGLKYLMLDQARPSLTEPDPTRRSGFGRALVGLGRGVSWGVGPI